MEGGIGLVEVCARWKQAESGSEEKKGAGRLQLARGHE
jgi:hypothetical protein